MGLSDYNHEEPNGQDKCKDTWGQAADIWECM